MKFIINRKLETLSLKELEIKKKKDYDDGTK